MSSNLVKELNKLSNKVNDEYNTAYYKKEGLHEYACTKAHIRRELMREVDKIIKANET